MMNQQQVRFDYVVVLESFRSLASIYYKYCKINRIDLGCFIILIYIITIERFVAAATRLSWVLRWPWLSSLRKEKKKIVARVERDSVDSGKTSPNQLVTIQLNVINLRHIAALLPYTRIDDSCTPTRPGTCRPSSTRKIPRNCNTILKCDTRISVFSSVIVLVNRLLLFLVFFIASSSRTVLPQRVLSHRPFERVYYNYHDSRTLRVRFTKW